jgi:hypothetical protein
MPEHRFPRPWSVEQTDACFIKKGAETLQKRQAPKQDYMLGGLSLLPQLRLLGWVAGVSGDGPPGRPNAR